MNITKHRAVKLRLAPEIEGNVEFIKTAKEKYPELKISLGHSTADYKTSIAGIEAGATQLTHTFNAMNPFLHRDLALPSAAFEDDRVFCEVISDGIHLHQAMVPLIYKMISSNRMLLISDSIAAAGLSDGKYILGGHINMTVKDGVARVDDGAIAGSTCNLMLMLRSAVRFGIPFEEAVKMAMLTPARSLGIDNCVGSIENGKQADFIVCDKNLNVYATFKNGKVVYGKLEDVN